MKSPGEDKHPSLQSFSMTGILILSLLYTVSVARPVLLPVMLALFFTFFFRPLIRVLKKIKIPEFVSAGLVIISFGAIIVYGAVYLSGPAGEWINKAPQTFQQLEEKVKGIIKPVETARRSAEQLNKLTGKAQEKNEIPAAPGPTLARTVLTGLREFLTQGVITIVLLFFLLASGDLFVIKLMKLFPGYEAKEEVIEIVHDVEYSISRYLLSITMINFGEGALVAAGMYLIGMPSPVLWGLMAALLIYIPYLGPFVGITVVTIVAFITLNDVRTALLAPGIYLSLEIIQAQFVTPVVLSALCHESGRDLCLADLLGMDMGNCRSAHRCSPVDDFQNSLRSYRPVETDWRIFIGLKNEFSA